MTLGALGAALMNEDERRTTAYHESGHALVAYLLPNMDAMRQRDDHAAWPLLGCDAVLADR